MRKCLTICLALAALLSPGMHGPLRAEWDWYAGDITRYPARNTAAVISERIQQGIDTGLDWLVLYGNFREGVFVGLREIVQEYDLNAPRIVPLLGAGWGIPGGAKGDLILFGIDPRAPLAGGGLQQMVLWAESHKGVSVLTHPDRLDDLPFGHQTGVAFQGVQGGKWCPACEPDAGWDRFLSSGRRIFLIGGEGGGGGPGGTQKTYVWAESNRPEQIIAGIRRGAAYVAQADGIQMDFRVNGRPMGSTVSVAQDAYVRLRAAARHPISRVLLIADGEIVWTARPDTAIWEERFFLPLNNRSYLRAVLESEEGNCRTMGNPIFLISESGEMEGELPIGEPDRLLYEAAYLEVEGALEVSANLQPEPQRRILSELLRDVRMRYATVQVLQDRRDLISDSLLWELAQHADREVRLGAAYALVARMPMELPGMLLKLLEDADPEVRVYAARMLFQYTEGGDYRQLAGLLSDPFEPVRMYLIRSFSPLSAAYDSLQARYLIAAIRSSHPGIAAAAVDKLIETGSRNYRIIRALLDSARAGNPAALEPIGWIGDRRSIPELERLFLREQYGSLKRACFLALEKMGAPYIGRKKVACPWTASPPRIDGYIGPGEWQDAIAIRSFAEDGEGAPFNREMAAFIARDASRLYLSVSCEDTLSPEVQVRSRDEDGIRYDDRIEWALSPSRETGSPYVFSVTPLGVVRDRKGADPTWDADWEAALFREPNRWTMECEIPLSAIDIDIDGPASPLRFNLSYLSGPAPARRWTWSVTYGSPDNPNRFGDVTLGTVPARSSNERSNGDSPLSP